MQYDKNVIGRQAAAHSIIKNRCLIKLEFSLVIEDYYVMYWQKISILTSALLLILLLLGLKRTSLKSNLISGQTFGILTLQWSNKTRWVRRNTWPPSSFNYSSTFFKGWCWRVQTSRFKKLVIQPSPLAIRSAYCWKLLSPPISCLLALESSN